MNNGDSLTNGNGWQYSNENFDRNTLIVRWWVYWSGWIDEQFLEYDPTEFLKVPIKYKCWGKGVQENDRNVVMFKY
ncbi:phage major capsid protein [Bacillus phage BCPG1]|uniref:Uncharacterized protein n=2 Tax=root TaxID=1 RepID=A0A173GC00_9CAUD|nr:hypothetical protein SALINJAH_271 [Bacillus phage SalinJah]ANH50827.1 hypothetical protein SALINJAH_271 [Bacillus phage SalinJah]QQO38906.1 phage major capsid protein [Bacillus phage BCPG1]